MRKPVELIRVPEGESGQIVQLTEDLKAELVELVVSGNRDQVSLAKHLGVNLFSLRNAMRDPRVLHQINLEVKARATVLMVDALESAARDMKHGDSKDRISGREFILRTAQDERVVMQQNTIHGWDPSHDEKLLERGREFFEKYGRRIATETVEAMLETDDGEGES